MTWRRNTFRSDGTWATHYEYAGDAGKTVRPSGSMPCPDRAGLHRSGHRRRPCDLRDHGALSRRSGAAETWRCDAGSCGRDGRYAGARRHRASHMIRMVAARLCRKTLPICHSIGDISQNPLEFEGSSSRRRAARGLAPRMRGRYHFDLKARLATKQARLDGLAQALGAGVHDDDGIDEFCHAKAQGGLWTANCWENGGKSGDGA